MTCKDCVHYEVCKIWCGEANIRMSTDCDFVKNKADFVEVKHGEWIETDYKTFDGFETETHPNEGLKCSLCNCVFRKNLLWCKNYCPECSAKMDGERRCSDG